MKYLFLSCFFVLCATLHAQQMEQLKLWPEEPHNEAELYLYFPSQQQKQSPAVLICPGGGYAGLAIDHEGHTMAKWFAEKGLVAIVLKYRLPKGEHTIPLKDAEKAMSVIRENAVKWGVLSSKVGVVGSSAGGHLAASLSTLATAANRPDFAILFYPVISLDDRITHAGSKQNLLGELIHDETYVDRYCLEKQIDAKTPKTLLLLSDDDTVVVPENSLLYYEALKNKQISAAMYIFPSGGHGFGITAPFTYHEEVKGLISKWLKYIQIL
ncbi:alpha/beta hydrolase [Parabacteroides sp. PF5-9]|uniref:alpha/beta hydrolase n=1 Tax=Parabacteroides sp. PF5-9 TaxID=1742404 RepID=UPI0024772B08|nr:alpha/beta hydrolase [Parabacteroides sp. PF5-9]MDH6358738.1 acetyl esterase/lipase [Parabacteroides sp. PF5-9]